MPSASCRAAKDAAAPMRLMSDYERCRRRRRCAAAALMRERAAADAPRDAPTPP